MSDSAMLRRGVVIGATALVVLLLAGVVIARSRAIEQPLPFNHVLHVEDVGAECTDCHLYVESGVRATIPGVAVCADCHEEQIGESEAEAWLVEQIATETPIPWQKLYSVPDHVFFSHRRHTSVAEIECATCHGAMAQRSEPPSRPLVSLSMDDCMQCHWDSGASNDCIACHR